MPAKAAAKVADRVADRVADTRPDKPPDPVPGPFAYCFAQTFAAAPESTAVFDRHYLLYAASGMMTLRAGEGRWTLLPSRAAWIPAGQTIGFAIPHGMMCCSLLYRADAIPAPDRVTVFPLPPLARDMILYSRRWGQDTAATPEAENFFRALADLARQAALQPGPNLIPHGQSAPVRTAIELTGQRLETPVTFLEIAALVHLSPRALSRRIAAETGLSWGQILQRQRMAHAAELLTHDTAGVAGAVFASGYSSVSAFTTAFRAFTGQSPAAFRAAQEGATTSRRHP